MALQNFEKRPTKSFFEDNYVANVQRALEGYRKRADSRNDRKRAMQSGATKKASKAPRIEKPGYLRNLLADEDGVEMCFEEGRLLAMSSRAQSLPASATPLTEHTVPSSRRTPLVDRAPLADRAPPVEHAAAPPSRRTPLANRAPLAEHAAAAPSRRTPLGEEAVPASRSTPLASAAAPEVVTAAAPTQQSKAPSSLPDNDDLPNSFTVKEIFMCVQSPDHELIDAVCCVSEVALPAPTWPQAPSRSASSCLLPRCRCSGRTPELPRYRRDR